MFGPLANLGYMLPLRGAAQGAKSAKNMQPIILGQNLSLIIQKASQPFYPKQSKFDHYR